VVKKTKKSKAKKSKGAAKRKAPAKATRAQSARDRKIAERILDTGNFPQAYDELQKIVQEIDRTYSGGPSLKLGESAARMAMAKRAFEDAIVHTDDLQDWIAAARQAAQLA
jgi:hypothetical protein